jgi:UDP-GlcNAc:undecaprenyl-phosphate/decaprenyl-phosphate GlcNAc-1-phosphate transferase
VIDAAAALASAVVTVLGLRTARRRLTGRRHVRQNFRGRVVVATAGLVLVLPLVVGLAWTQASAPSGGDDARVAIVTVCAGLLMAALGFVDDVYGDRHAGGLIGHARALLRGTLTTGMLKAGGGAVLGLASGYAVGWRGWWVIPAGAVVALASNLANLFDLRPGRVIKLWLPCALVIALVGANASERTVLSGLAGGVAVFGVWEMRERVMLGDTGAGLLGAVLGVGAIASAGRTAVLVELVVLLALTLVSEAVSFTRVIDAVPPLRWLDRLGRRAD